MANLPPTMTERDLLDYMLQEKAALTREEREEITPILETLCGDIFRSQGNPRTIITPKALALGRGALAEICKILGIKPEKEI